MLWHKSWVDTRWRFLVGLALLTLSALGVVFAYPRVMRLIPLAPPVDTSGEIGRQIKEAVDLARNYRGYVWSQWFRQNMLQMWTVFAVLLGSGSLLAQGSRGGLFTLSLPVSRNRLLWVRAATALAELAALAVVPALLLPLLSPAIGQTYGVADALVHGACMFAAGTVFFSLAFLLSTTFDDLWRPLLIALVVAMVLALCPQVFRELSPYSVFTVMSGEVYFRTGRLPLVGMLVSAAASAAMLYVATLTLARRDF
jgi:ABC-2 type transport system permease protein